MLKIQSVIRQSLIVLLALCVAGCASVDDKGEAKLDPGRIEAVKNYLHASVDDGRISGVVTLVASNGHVELFDAYGYRDIENQLPMEKDTIFRIFSMTKPVTGTALMMLYDEGRFQLDDPVEKYLPEFAGIEVYAGTGEGGALKTLPADHPLTIRELMSHTGGLVYPPPLGRGPVAEVYADADVLDRDSSLKEMAHKLSQIPLNHQPGTQWVYSISVDVQGYLVEVLSGMSFDEFLEAHIFAPLGMNDTAFYVTPDKAGRLARYYRPGKDGTLVSAPNGPFLKKPGLFSGGGGLTSTAADYLKFAEMHRLGGELDGTRILSPEAAGLMHQNQLPPAVESVGRGAPGNVFGLDFAIVSDPASADGVSQGSYWWWGIAGSWFWVDPATGLVFIGMIQNGDVRYSRTLHSGVKRLLYEPLPTVD